MHHIPKRRVSNNKKFVVVVGAVDMWTTTIFPLDRAQNAHSGHPDERCITWLPLWIRIGCVRESTARYETIRDRSLVIG
jgi:hypothetical protein